MSAEAFVDSNVLIYAHDLDAGQKRKVAASLLKELWEKEDGIVSTQVLQEFYVNATAKIPHPLSPAIARGVVEDYRTWQPQVITVDTILRAAELQERHHLSFWDAMIIAAAVRSGASVLYTEDLSHGQMIEGVRIENPFRATG